MSFPKYKTIKKKFLFWEYEESVRDGWYWVDIKTYMDHTKCGVRANVGEEKETGERFLYCPACMVKTGGPAYK